MKKRVKNDKITQTEIEIEMQEQTHAITQVEMLERAHAISQVEMKMQEQADTIPRTEMLEQTHAISQAEMPEQADIISRQNVNRHTNRIRAGKKKTASLSALKLYGHYVSVNLKSLMQYKTSFFLTVLGQFLVSFNVFLGIYFMFQRFHSVKGFTYSEVLLCFSIVLLEFSIAEMIARGFDRFSELVKTGIFDQILVRPRHEILQVLGSKFELTRIGRMLQAVIMFLYAVLHCGVQWNIPKIITVFFMLIGGTALFSGLFMIYAALCFFTLDGLEFMNIFTDGAKEFGKYPIEVYGPKMLLFTTFIIPYSLVQYYPLLYLLERTHNPLYLFIPLCALLFLIPCYALWNCGVRHYQSSGS